MAYYPRPIEFGAHYSLYSAETGVTATFNNPFDPNYVGMLTEVTGLDSPDVRENSEDLVESDGGVHGRFYYGRRPITLSGKVFGHASLAERAYRLDLARRASQALRQDAQLTWLPSQRVDNVIFNPRFANDLSGWGWSIGGATSVTQTRVTGQNAPGTPATTTACELAFTTASNGQYVSAISNPVAINMPDGSSRYVGNVDDARYQYVHGQAAVQVVSVSAGASPSFQLNARAYDTNNVLLGVVQITQPTVGVGGWVNVAGSLPISALPAGTARVTVSLTSVGKSAASYVVRLTNLMAGVRWDNKVPDYLDGSKSGGYWHTVADGGPSGDYIPMGVSVRRQQPFRESGAWVKDFQIALVSDDPYILSPYMRGTNVNLGSSTFVNNQGNANFYPTVMVYSQFNAGAHFDSNGGVVEYLGDMDTAPVGTFVSMIDMLQHTVADFSLTGVGGPNNLDWGAMGGAWPSIAPGGGMWSFTNGAVGGYTGGHITVVERDAWV